MAETNADRCHHHGLWLRFESSSESRHEVLVFVCIGWVFTRLNNSDSEQHSSKRPNGNGIYMTSVWCCAAVASISTVEIDEGNAPCTSDDLTFAAVSRTATQSRSMSTNAIGPSRQHTWLQQDTLPDKAGFEDASNGDHHRIAPAARICQSKLPSQNRRRT